MFVVITPSLPVAGTFYCIVTFIVSKVLIDASSYIMLNVITYARLILPVVLLQIVVLLEVSR
jgi:hypothetical protein